jgi:hypothetical protein
VTHTWSTYRCDNHRQHDECLRCRALRWKSVNTGWAWKYRRGGKICQATIDPNPAERLVMVEGRE